MTLKEIFDDLAMGVLANLSLTDSATQSITTGSYQKVISYVNLALTALHKRFLLREGEVIIQLHPDMSRYPLRTQFAMSNEASTEPIKFIVDHPGNPWIADILKIEKVFSELGEPLPLNEPHSRYPVYTPEFDVISALPTSDMPQALFITYRAKYPKINLTSDADLTLIEINIPDAILDALYARVGAQAYKGMNSEEGETSASRSYMMQYELECQRLETDNVLFEDHRPVSRFKAKGWV